MKKPKRPKDLNQTGKLIVDLATGETTEPNFKSLSDYASELGRKGGLVGGKARAKALSKAERVKIAQKAANVRWKKAK